MSENILCVKNIKKSFGGVHALKGVDLTIKKGETHCLAGENGCGKSTIIKVISGFYKPDEGTIEIDGKEYTNMSTADAIAAGIQVIYQDFSIFPNLTVMENLAFNQVKQVQIEDAAAADETFSMLMGDEVEPRRLFIQRNARNVSWIDA